MDPKDVLTRDFIAIYAKRGSAVDTACCALVIGLLKKELPVGAARELDKAMGGALTKIVSGVDAGPDLAKSHMMFAKQFPIKPERIIIVGVGGKSDQPALEKVRLGFAEAARLCEEVGLKKIVGLFPAGGSAELAQAMAEGFALGAYRWDRFKSEKRIGAEEFTVLASNARDLKNAEKGAHAAKIVSETVWFVRDMCNMPSNEMTPRAMAEIAKALAKEHGLLARISGPEEMRKENMAGLLAVNKGSAEEPRFIELEYNGSRAKGAKPIVLVGKAITFDSGGISIKPSDKMDEMKFDMSGGAIVLGVVCAAGRLGLPVRIIGLVPCTENLPDSKAYKPGDVVTYKNGKTVEIISTDAEGRMILADALLRAGELEPKLVVDLATLTLSVKLIFAGHAAGIIGNNEPLIKALVRAGEAVSDRLWQLPFWSVYDELIKGDTADIKNSGGRDGSTLTATRFLSKFVSYPWAHIDIAGSAWVDKDKGYLPKGGTGYGVRLLIHWLKGQKG